MYAKTDGHLIFATVFFSNVIGASLVTLNATFLGLKASFFATVCLMGYCLFPLTASAFVIIILSSVLPYYVRLVIVAGSFCWACLCKMQFDLSGATLLMIPFSQKGQGFLLLFPVCLYYLFQAVFIITV